MPRYELVEGSSNKFWEITLDGASFTTTYGRIGTDGQSTLKEFPSEALARKEYEKLVAEKVKKGYELADGVAPPAPPKEETAKAKSIFEDEGDEVPRPKAPPRAAPPKEAPAKSSKSGDSGARYFELVEGASSKFWEIQLDGASFTTRYGRIGTDGQTSLKEYASDAQARKEYEKLVAEKTKKGYLEK